jgi:phosphotransferase system  glucose/maltose/N-acetylglucosamine-specific IIC component
MDGGTVVLLSLVVGTILFILQRTEKQRKRGVQFVMGLLGLVVIWYVGMRQYWGEAVIALLIAMIVNFLFWVLIGRYNPVGSSDDIRVLGLDD